MKFEPVVFATDEEAIKAYDSGRCDAYTTDASGLYAERLKMAAPDDHIVLPEIISKEPLGPSVRKDDIQWFQIVQWTHYALVTAEELGVTQANVDEKLKSDNPEIRRLLGVEGDFGKGLGLTNDWAYRIIKAVGNYGEIFERNVGHGLADQDQRGASTRYGPRAACNTRRRSGEGGLLPPSRAGREAHRLLGGAEQRLRLVDAFALLVGGIAVVDDAGARLHMHQPVLDDRGAQHDAGVHLARGAEIADAAAVDAALVASPARR